MTAFHFLKARYPYDKGPHGILMRYLQNLRYFTIAITVVWFILVLKFNLLIGTFSLRRFVIIITAGIIYLLIAEATLYVTYSRSPDSAEDLIKLFGIADITIITAGVMISGGSLSPFVLIYLFPLANFRIIYGDKRSFMVAGVCLTSYFFALLVSSGITHLQLLNFLVLVVPCFLAFTYYLGLILRSEKDSRMEGKKLAESYQRSRLLYQLSKEINQITEYGALAELVWEAVEPVVSVKGMKVFYDENDGGPCRLIYARETEDISWNINLKKINDEDVGPEILQSTQCGCGFFVLPLGQSISCGIIVIRGNQEDLQPTHYEEYLQTVAEIAAAGLKNIAIRQKLELQSMSDGLTGLLNNHSFFSRLEELISEAQRYRIDLALAMLDLDYFKSINDSYGHLVGDRVLRHCADIVRDGVRKSDLVARYGGEEFAIIMPHTDMDGAVKLMERIRQLVEERIFAQDGVSCRVTVSIGLCSWEPPLQAGEMVKIADDALYKAKKNGRNQVVSQCAAR